MDFDWSLYGTKRRWVRHGLALLTTTRTEKVLRVLTDCLMCPSVCSQLDGDDVIGLLTAILQVWGDPASCPRQCYMSAMPASCLLHLHAP